MLQFFPNMLRNARCLIDYNNTVQTLWALSACPVRCRSGCSFIHNWLLAALAKFYMLLQSLLHLSVTRYTSFTLFSRTRPRLRVKYSSGYKIHKVGAQLASKTRFTTVVPCVTMTGVQLTWINFKAPAGGGVPLHSWDVTSPSSGKKSCLWGLRSCVFR